METRGYDSLLDLKTMLIRYLVNTIILKEGGTSINRIKSIILIYNVIKFRAYQVMHIMSRPMNCIILFILSVCAIVLLGYTLVLWLQQHRTNYWKECIRNNFKNIWIKDDINIWNCMGEFKKIIIINKVFEYLTKLSDIFLYLYIYTRGAKYVDQFLLVILNCYVNFKVCLSTTEY